MRRAIGGVRGAYDLFTQNEAQILQKRRSTAEAEERHYLWTLASGAALGFGALFFASLVIFALIGRNLKAEARLHESEKRFTDILNGLNDGIYDYNVPEGSIYYSPSYKSLLGYSKKATGGPARQSRSHV